MAYSARTEGELAGRGNAPLVTLVSASGGVGKSTLSLLIAHAAARRDVKTALVEGDLQFGDMGFWLGLDVALSNLAQGTACQPTPIADNLGLYKAPVLPEIAEEVADAVAMLVPEVRMRNDLVIADTGQFWSGLTGELLCAADLVLVVMDQRRASVYGAIKALELCRRFGIPDARVACVLNRASGMPRSELEHVRQSLGCDELFRIADGKGAVETLVGTGRIEELVEGDGAPMPDVELLMARLLPRIGIEYAVAQPKARRRLFA